jgi:uncharacterized SAM-binding protein YcdF (DUF218 family)
MNMGIKLAKVIYSFLNIGESLHRADSLFVFAGNQKRKIYGVNLWHQGYARQMILSIGRFEWRKFYELDLDSDGGLRFLVDQTPPQKRHFFLQTDGNETSCTLVQTGFLGTLSEGRLLAEFLNGKPIKSLLVVSSASHLRRASLVLRHAFRSKEVQLSFIAVPEESAWKSPSGRNQIWVELWKYIFYRIFYLVYI